MHNAERTLKITQKYVDPKETKWHNAFKYYNKFIAEEGSNG